MNTWTKRNEERSPVAIDSIQNDLLVAFNSAERDSRVILNVNNIPDTDPAYFGDAYVERKRLALTPEFDTETAISWHF